MPNDFMKCKDEGGKIRTKDMGKGKYSHVCIDKMGKTHMGEVKMKKMMAKTTKGAFIRSANKV